MNCKQTTELFDSYLNNTINPATKQALEEHLKTCETCRKQLELYRFYFSDVKIEDDFSVPSQLNAKIHYAIHQAKSKKESQKIPFWQNKRILSAATVCAFLFVAGIWGISNYSGLQDAANTPVTETADPGIAQEHPLSENRPDIPNPASVTNQEHKQQTQTPDYTPEVTIPDASEDVAAYSEQSPTNLTTDIAAEPFVMPRTMAVPEDICLSAEWMDTLLEAFPHEVITEDVYLVTVSKAELESVLGHGVDTDETKTQLFIRFAPANE